MKLFSGPAISSILGSALFVRVIATPTPGPTSTTEVPAKGDLPIDNGQDEFGVSNIKLHPGHVRELRYGPEAGVYGSPHLYWTEEPNLKFPGNRHRTIAELVCTRKSNGGRLIGLQAGFRVEGEDPAIYHVAYGSYHGWYTWHNTGETSQTLQLDTRHGESISKITFMTCGKHFEGVKIETNVGQWIECGQWQYTKVKDFKWCKNGGGGELEPPKNRKVIGLYGDAKKDGHDPDERGIRGLGLITIPLGG